MSRAAWDVVDRFEEALAAYCGSKYAVTVDSCTNAIFLCLRYQRAWDVSIPKHTYVGVVQAARNAASVYTLTDEEWVGEYTMGNSNIVDAAKWLRRGMFRNGTLTCISFQAYKQLPIGRGGAILTSDYGAAEWLRRARFDGRGTEETVYEQETFHEGYHMYMTPPDAARGLWLMQSLSGDNAPIGSWEDYPDLSKKRWA